MVKEKKETKKVTIKLGYVKVPDEKGRRAGKMFFVTRLRPWPRKHARSAKDLKINVSDLRRLLSDEKARILYEIKVKKPRSIYFLAKELKRDFKAVRQDLKLLESFGFVRLIKEEDKKSGKTRLRPVVAVDKLQVTLEL